ncbi:tyrosine-type recombinase/integrase [Alphaproteobacteria bacterium]|nr:tyrosine-type recombinase/integrase [Alphaproteobacteria bacterium]
MKYEKYKDLYTQFLISEKNLSKNSLNNYLVDLDQFFFDQDSNSSNINIKIKTYIARLRKRNLKTSSVNRKISTLKNYLKFLHTEKIIEQIDFQEFESLSSIKKIPKAISKSQMEQIFEDLKKSKQTNAGLYILILKLIYLSGLRISEALNLKWSDINYQDNSIYVYGKGSKERKVFIINDYLVQLKNLEKNNQFVFTINKKKISTRSVNKFLQNCYDNSLIKNKLSSHIFRHSFATTMLENNADIRHIQKLLGHTSISTTEIYTKVAKSMKKRVLDSYHPLKNKL